MKQAALATTLITVLLLSSYFMLPVEAEQWSTPVPILYMETPIKEISMSANGSKIVFCAGTDTNQQVFVVNSNGTGLKQLTNSSRVNNHALISGNAEKITFASSKVEEPSRGILVWSDRKACIMNSDGTGLRQLPENSWASYPSLSDNGEKVALQQAFNISLINSDGTGLRTLNDPNSILGDVPSISGDGRRVIFIGYVNSNYELFVVNSDGTSLTQITDGTGKGNGCGPVISVDGNTIIFSTVWTQRDGALLVSQYNQNFEQGLTAENQTKLWSTPTTFVSMNNAVAYCKPAITADGRKIFFVESDFQSSNGRLFTVNSDGTGLKKIFDDEPYPIVINNNGSMIAFFNIKENAIYVSVDLQSGLQPPEPAASPVPSLSPEPSLIPPSSQSPTPTLQPALPVQSPTPQQTSKTTASPTAEPREEVPELQSEVVLLFMILMIFNLVAYRKLKNRAS